jgi:hypothetical protein
MNGLAQSARNWATSKLLKRFAARENSLWLCWVNTAIFTFKTFYGFIQL